MSTQLTQRPAPTEYPPYGAGYIALVPAGDILAVLAWQSDETQALLRGVDEARAAYRYAPAKWSIKQVVGHMIDTERVFSYRALCLARGDTQPLPGMEQDDYIAHANFDAYPLADLADELAQVRRTTLYLLRHLDAAAWARHGTANKHPVSVRALAFLIAGHELHHVGVLRTNYL